MKVYIAGRYSKLAELKQESLQFEAAGIEITSSWLNNMEDGLTFEDIAVLDLNDVDRADTLVLYTEPYGTLVPGGGRHVEFGYALGRGKRVLIVGPLENVFSWHPSVITFPRTEYAVRYLSTLPAHAINRSEIRWAA